MANQILNIIVDYENFRDGVLRRLHGIRRRDRMPDRQDADDSSVVINYLDDCIEQKILGQSLCHVSQNLIIDVRLYGGWRKGLELSESAIALNNDITNRSRFINAMSCKLRRHYKLAQGLLDLPDVTIYHTLRPRPPAGRFGVDDMWDGCTSEDICAVRNARQCLLAGRCPDSNCSAQAPQRVRNHKEAGVDVHIAADLLSFSRDSSRKSVILISDDEDYFPAVLAASLSGRHTDLIWAKVTSSETRYEQELKSHGVRTVTLYRRR